MLRTLALASVAVGARAAFPAPPAGLRDFSPFWKTKGVCRDALVGKEYACNTDSLDVSMSNDKHEDVFLKFMTLGSAASSIDERFAEIFPFQLQAVDEVFVLVVERDDADNNYDDRFEQAEIIYEGSRRGKGRKGREFRVHQSTRDIVAAGVCACNLGPAKSVLPFQNSNSGKDAVESPSKFICFLQEDSINDSTMWGKGGKGKGGSSIEPTGEPTLYDIFGPWDYTASLSGSVRGSNLRAFSISATLQDSGIQELVFPHKGGGYASKGKGGKGGKGGGDLPTIGELFLDHYSYTPYTRSLLDCVSNEYDGGYDSEFLFPPSPFH
jgi:hypothetical protein